MPIGTLLFIGMSSVNFWVPQKIFIPFPSIILLKIDTPISLISLEKPQENIFLLEEGVTFVAEML